jgi:hypothetical protein
MIYRIRFNKTRGQEGRGSMEHVWRVFEDEKEYLVKHLDITVPVKSEKDINGADYNIVCEGTMTLDRDTSTAIISRHVAHVVEGENIVYLGTK